MRQGALHARLSHGPWPPMASRHPVPARSMRLDHRRVALQRMLMMEAAGLEVSEATRAFCEPARTAVPPRELERMHEAGAARDADWPRKPAAHRPGGLAATLPPAVPARPMPPTPSIAPTSRSGGARAVRLAAAAALLAAGGAGAQPLQWAGQWALASELTDRGLLIGPRRPTLQAGLTALHDQRWTLSLSASAPIGALREGRVLAQLGRYHRLSDDWQLDAGLAYYGYPGSARAGEGNRWELQSGASYRDVLSAGLTALHYPAWPGRRAGLQWALDLGLRWPLAAGWSATASLGWADLPPAPQWRYHYGGLGLAWQGGPWRLELNRLGSNATARRVMGAAGQSRWSATLSHAF